MKITTSAALVSMLGLLAAAGTVPAGQPNLVVLSGTQAPGQPSGVLFDFFSDPRLNASGEIAFWAELDGPGITADDAGSVWLITAAAPQPTLVRRQGDASPIAGHHFGALPSFAFNNLGHFAFAASLVETGVPSHPTRLGMFAEEQTGLTTIAVEEEPAIGLPGEDWSGLPLPQLAVFGPQNATAFHASGGAGLWRYAEGLLNLRHASGSEAPGTALEFAYLDEARLGGRGDFAFRATLAPTGSPTAPPTSSGIFKSITTETQVLALEGDQAPGFPAGVEFVEFSAQPASALTESAFWARVDGPGITADNNSGIWAGTPGDLHLVARGGDAAPGTEPGTVFASFSRQPVMAPTTPRGTVAFIAYLAGPAITSDNNSGVWVRSTDGTLALLAREGEQAPRMPAGTEFANFGPLHLNERGQVAFTTYLRGAAVMPADNFALYATDRPGNLMVIIRKGDEVDAAGTPERVAEIIFDSGAPGAGQSQFVDVSGRGMLIYMTRFITTPPAVKQALYTSQARCLADANGDGMLNIDDFLAFINAFAAGNLRIADADGNGILNIDDFLAFIDAFAQGCG